MSRWQRRLDLSDVFHADMPFPEKRDEMVRRVRGLDPHNTDCELHDIADELAATATPNEWDAPWNAFYDWADYNSVWVNTFGKTAVTK